MSDDHDDSSIGRGGLADQLAELDIDAPDKDDSEQETSGRDEDLDRAEKDPRPRDSGEAPGDSQLSDEELFEKAIAEMSPDEARRAKQPASSSAQRASRRLSETEDADELPPEEELPEKATPEPRHDQEAASDKPKTERELFEEAVSGIGPEDVYRGKFEGRGPTFEDDAEPEPKKQPGVPGQKPERDETQTPELDEQAARETLDELRTMRQFEKAVGPIDRDIERDKYRDRTQKRDPKKDVERRLAFRSDAPDQLDTPPLPKSGEGLNNVGSLDPAHKDLLERFQKRARRKQVFEINVRGDTVDDALRQVELFVHQQWKERAKFCRIVHGRGLRSEGAPVLKPAILHWLEGPGFRYVRGYAPETNNAGDYGSIVVELTERREDK